MQALELPLFSIDTPPSTTITPVKQEISHEQIITPAIQVLATTPTSSFETKPHVNESIYQTLDELFPEQKYEEKNIQKAKEVLGETAKEFTAEQLKDIINEIQYLADTWLDDFERQTFGGRTLAELLHEKGGQ